MRLFLTRTVCLLTSLSFTTELVASWDIVQLLYSKMTSVTSVLWLCVYICTPTGKTQSLGREAARARKCFQAAALFAMRKAMENTRPFVLHPFRPWLMRLVRYVWFAAYNRTFCGHTCQIRDAWNTHIPSRSPCRQLCFCASDKRVFDCIPCRWCQPSIRRPNACFPRACTHSAQTSDKECLRSNPTEN